MRKSNTPEGRIDRLEYQEEQLNVRFEYLKRQSVNSLSYPALFFVGSKRPHSKQRHK
jgi:hypothetical protein